MDKYDVNAHQVHAAQRHQLQYKFQQQHLQYKFQTMQDGHHQLGNCDRYQPKTGNFFGGGELHPDEGFK